MTKQLGVWDPTEMADRGRDKVDNGEIVICKECGRNAHNPYFKRCWNCNQRLLKSTRAAEMGNDDGSTFN